MGNYCAFATRVKVKKNFVQKKCSSCGLASMQLFFCVFFRTKIVYNRFCTMTKKPPLLLRISQTFLYLTFFLVPIVYSHIYLLPFEGTLYGAYRSHFPLLAWFEKIKVITFVACTLCSALACALHHFLSRGKKNRVPKIEYILGGALCVFFLLSTLLAPDPFEAFVWSPNKSHGYILYISLVVFWFCLRTVGTTTFFKKSLQVTLLSACIVFLYAQFQVLWVDPNISTYDSRVRLDRVFSTLGNANYLAGYVLILFPVLMGLRKRWDISSFFFILWCVAGSVLLIQTGSLIGIGVLILYLISLSFRHFRISQWYLLGGVMVCMIAGGYLLLGKVAGEVAYHFFVYPTGDVRTVYLDHLDIVTLPEKLRGFLARPFFWSTGIHGLLDPIRFFVGYGPDQLQNVYTQIRHPFLMHDILEHTDWIADRSHNFFLDVWIHGGLGSFVLMCYFFFRAARSDDDIFRDTFVVFGLFFFLNIPVLTHYILLMLVASAHLAKKSSN